MAVLTVKREGGSRVLAVTKVVPKEWELVEIEEVKKTKDSVTIKICKVR